MKPIYGVSEIISWFGFRAVFAFFQLKGTAKWTKSKSVHILSLAGSVISDFVWVHP